MPERKDLSLDITSLIHSNHQKTRNLFFEVNNSTNNEVKAMLVTELLYELYINNFIEERVIYPRLQQKCRDSCQFIAKAEIQHELIKSFMAELFEMEPEENLYDARLAVLNKLVDYLYEEEKNLLKQLRRDNVELGDIWEEALEKREVLQKQALSMSINESRTTAVRTVKIPGSRGFGNFLLQMNIRTAKKAG